MPQKLERTVDMLKRIWSNCVTKIGAKNVIEDIAMSGSWLTTTTIKHLSIWISAVLLLNLVAIPKIRAETWNGAGILTYENGVKERVKCRARTEGRPPKSPIVVSTTCSTASGSASHEGTFRRTGPNVYSGSFYNAEYNINVDYHAVVRGNTIVVTYKATGGHATVTYTLQE
jgi:hypothetical protein